MSLLQTTYMGLKLQSPIIAGSSGLSKSIDNIVEMEKCGVGAIVLKSIFEEQIRNEAKVNLQEADDSTSAYSEAFDYIKNYSESNSVEEYLTLIKEAKSKVKTPIIASINCVSDKGWLEYAQKFEKMGADAIELNIYVLPSDFNKTADEIEKIYFNIVEAVLKQVSIPVSVKISEYFSSLSKFVVTLSWTGIKGIVLFNRPFSPDINIDNMQLTSTNIFSNPQEVAHPMRWIALLSPKSHCDLAASTGVHDGESVIKLLLAGASAVQVCSALYKNKISVISDFNSFVENWMKKNKYKSIEEFRGKMNYKSISNPSAYERVQFMKYFSGIE